MKWTKEHSDMMDEAYGDGKPTVTLCVDPPIEGWSRKGTPVGGDELDDYPGFEFYNQAGECFLVYFDMGKEVEPTVIVNGKPFYCPIHSWYKMELPVDPNTGCLCDVANN